MADFSKKDKKYYGSFVYKQTIINCTDNNLIQTKHWKHGVGRESQSEEEKWK